jgi:hypothetical protein
MNLRLSTALSAIVIVVAGSGAAAINFAVLDKHGPEKTDEIKLGVIAPAANPSATLEPFDVTPSDESSPSTSAEPTEEPDDDVTPSTSASASPTTNFDCKDEEDDNDEDDESTDGESDDDFDDDNCGDD